MTSRDQPCADGAPNPVLTADAYADLRAAAEKATSGPWEASDDSQTVLAGTNYTGMWSRVRVVGDGSAVDLEFIALANPATVLRLLDDLDNWRSRAAERDAECERRARKQWDAEAGAGVMADALQRIADATPASTNNATADRMCSWTRAVARTALADGAVTRPTVASDAVPGTNPNPSNPSGHSL